MPTISPPGASLTAQLKALSVISFEVERFLFLQGFSSDAIAMKVATGRRGPGGDSGRPFEDHRDGGFPVLPPADAEEMAWSSRLDLRAP